MHYAILVEEGYCRRQLGDVKANNFLFQRPKPFEVDWGKVRKEVADRGSVIHTSQITTEHQIQHEEAILVILEGVAQVNDVGMVDLETVSEERVGYECGGPLPEGDALV